MGGVAESVCGGSAGEVARHSVVKSRCSFPRGTGRDTAACNFSSRESGALV